MVVVQWGKCPTPRKKGRGIVRYLNIRGNVSGGYAQGECPDPILRAF